MAETVQNIFPNSKLDHLDINLLETEYVHEILDEKTARTQSKMIEEIKSNQVLCNESEIMLESNEEKKEDKIPLSVIIFYSLPSFGKMSCLVLLNIHAMLYYESIGASLLYMSFFVALARACEIILKPIIAHLSDESKSQYGRRKPYMLLGCGFYAIFLILLFSPPSMKTEIKNISIWFGMFYVLFFLAETITNVPYLALGPEISSNSKERERLYVFFYLFQYIGVLFAAGSPVLLNRLMEKCDCTLCITNPLILDIPKCISKCKILCSVRNTEHSLFYLSIFIGIFFITSIILLSLHVKEKKQSFNPQPSRFLPSLYQLIQNRPFLYLIPPWILDVTIMTIFSTMLPFFLNFVINPQRYCLKNNMDLNKVECSVNYWLGLTISIFFIFCIMFIFIWHYLVKLFGKNRCWQGYSIVSVFAFSLFLMCEEGSQGIMIFGAILASFPAGAAYINDVLVADTIDYDEFFTGKRTEGIYTVCSAFIPKVVSIFAQTVPLSIMALLGFIPSSNGISHEQPRIVIEFIRFFFIGMPCLLALTSFFFKLKYPIQDDGMMNNIKTAITLQKNNVGDLQNKCDYYKIKDPVFGHKHMNIFIKDEAQMNTKIFTDHFQDIQYLKLIYCKEYEKLRSQIMFNILGSAILFIVFMFTLIVTFTFLQTKSLSFIPLGSLFIVSISIIIIIINAIRYSVIAKVIDGEYKIDDRFLQLLVLNKLFEYEKEEKIGVDEKEKIKF